MFTKGCGWKHPLLLRCVTMYRAAGKLIGQGVSNFITDWDKVAATVSYHHQ